MALQVAFQKITRGEHLQLVLINLTVSKEKNEREKRKSHVFHPSILQHFMKDDLLYFILSYIFDKKSLPSCIRHVKLNIHSPASCLNCDLNTFHNFQNFMKVLTAKNFTS